MKQKVRFKWDAVKIDVYFLQIAFQNETQFVMQVILFSLVPMCFSGGDVGCGRPIPGAAGPPHGRDQCLQTGPGGLDRRTTGQSQVCVNLAPLQDRSYYVIYVKHIDVCGQLNSKDII